MIEAGSFRVFMESQAISRASSGYPQKLSCGAHPGSTLHRLNLVSFR
jgi:hypothetical protein